ncbi:MAG: hypothetical protein KDA93_11370 [Planctomycetaceae bacterium]|nr:hypothetical protein [Planctomycetaceae bacterium]
MRQHTSTIRSSRRGITLVEVAISTLLVGLVMVASLRSVASVMRTFQVASDQGEAMDLARELMAEITQHAYQDPEEPGKNLGTNSGESGGDREDFDDVDDYYGWSASPPETQEGEELTEFVGWTRSVVVKKVSSSDPTVVRNDNSADQGVKRIAVTVTDPEGASVTLTSIRAISGAQEEPLGIDATIVSAVDVTLKVGTSPVIESGTSLVNHALDQ